MKILKTKYREPNITLREIGMAIRIIFLIKNWWVYFSDFLGKYKSDGQIYFLLRNGRKLRIQPNSFDRNFFNEIWLNEQYNPRGFEIKPSDTVVDIGANNGMFSIYAGHKAKRGRVYAFEPEETNFNKLMRNIQINKMRNIIPDQKAVSDDDGIKDFFIFDSSLGGNSFFNEKIDEGKGIARKSLVETVSFKNLMIENVHHIDFLKMDCEGAEYEILFSMGNLLKRISKMALEVHNLDKERNMLKMITFLRDSGYCVKRRGSLLFAKRNNQCPRKYLMQSWKKRVVS